MATNNVHHTYTYREKNASKLKLRTRVEKPESTLLFMDFIRQWWLFSSSLFPSHTHSRCWCCEQIPRVRTRSKPFYIWHDSNIYVEHLCALQYDAICWYVCLHLFCHGHHTASMAFSFLPFPNTHTHTFILPCCLVKFVSLRFIHCAICTFPLSSPFTVLFDLCLFICFSFANNNNNNGIFFYTITGERFFDDFDAFVSVLVFLVCYTRTSFAGPLIPSVDVCFFETSKLSSAVESVSIGGVLVVAVAGAAITVSLISDTVVSDWISLVSYCCFEILSSLSHPPPNPSPLLPSVLMMTSAECAASIASGKLTQHIFIGGGDWWWCTSEICGTWSFPSSASLLFALESVRMQWPLLLFFERLDDWWRWLTSSGSSSNLLSTISILFVDGDTVGGEHDDGGCGGDGADDGCAGGGGGNGADGCCGVIGDTFCSLHGSDVLLQFVELLLKFDKTLLKFIVCVAISTYRTQPFPSAPGWIESG